MKLTFEQEIFSLERDVEFRLRFNGDRICEIRELVPKELLTDKMLAKRAIDRLFYELREQVYKEVIK